MIVVDPVEVDDVLLFVRALRRNSGVPILLVAETEGLRAATRTRALRSGADDFLQLDGSAQELLSRVEAARVRGPKPTADRLRRETLLVQPRDERGQVLALPESEIVRAARHHLTNSEHPFFALVRLRIAPDTVLVAWQALVRGLRLKDGDLIAKGGDNSELVVYLNDISRRHARELIARILSGDPRLEAAEVTIDHYPADSSRIDAWLKERARPEALRAAG
jgi:hypothetical protein